MTATQQKFISDFLFLIEISVLILVFIKGVRRWSGSCFNIGGSDSKVQSEF